MTGPATVLEAMQAGKTAAESIDRYIQGKSLTRVYKPTEPRLEVPPVDVASDEETEYLRPFMSKLPIEQRIRNFKEVELGFSLEDAVREAKRCFRCDLENIRRRI